VKILRDAAQKKGLNTAAVAKLAGLARARTKHVLAGAEPLTVDEFIVLAGALELDALGLQAAITTEEAQGEAEAKPPVLAEADEVHLAPQVIDPWGNHSEQVLKMGFGLGTDMFFVLDAALIQEIGLPADVLERFSDGMPIKLDAAFHQHHDPRFYPEGLQVTLSFDALYTVCIPWPAIRQITLFPLPPADADPVDTEEDETPAGGAGHLRLVD
jgi:transcriptional regulator with XRE-family HTH domain